MIDPSGIYGATLDYAQIIFYSGTAMIIFLCLWKKGLLDMNEEPAKQMLQDDEEIQ